MFYFRHSVPIMVRIQEGGAVMARRTSTASGSGGQRGRSAITGRFVKQATVRRHPATTVNERVTPKPKKRK
jgi:hypothetical protein